jgi:DNA-binding response OmpR family regulator
MLNRKLKTVLIIDDEAGILDICLEYFEDVFNVVVSKNFSEALFKLSNQDFDLVLTDMMMPGKDGIALIGEIQKMARKRRMRTPPIIAMTGLADIYREKISKIKNCSIIEKPFQLDDLQKIIIKMIKESEAVEVKADTEASASKEAAARESKEQTFEVKPQKISLPANEIIINLGDLPDGAFRVMNGELEVISSSGVIVAVLGVGEAFGEMSTIEKLPSDVIVRSKTACDLVFIPDELLWRILSEQPKWFQDMMTGLSKKLRITTAKVSA